MKMAHDSIKRSGVSRLLVAFVRKIPHQLNSSVRLRPMICEEECPTKPREEMVQRRFDERRVLRLGRSDHGGFSSVPNTDRVGLFVDEHSSSLPDKDSKVLDGLTRDGPALLDESKDGFRTSEAVLNNFRLMAILFSAVPASALACLSLATARLGALGAWQSGTLYLSYTLSALTFSIHVVKRIGSRNALVLGMSLFCTYVGCFLMATVIPTSAKAFALMGAVVGGVGAGIMWTSQGTYFAEAADEYGKVSNMDRTESNGYLGGIFACVLLAEETTLDLLSTLLVRGFNVEWNVVFSVYFAVAVCILLCHWHDSILDGST